MNDVKNAILEIFYLLSASWSLLLLNVTFGATPTFAQANLYGFDQSDDHGLTDTTGKELVPPIYAGIKYLGHGLFLLKQKGPEQAKQSDSAKEKILLNKSFTKVKTSVPVGTTFDRILWLGSSGQEDQDFDAVPKDALLVFKKGSYFGVCDKNGTIVLPADCVWIGNFSDGIVACRKSDGILYSYNFVAKTIQKLSYQNVRQDCRLTFSDGLAAFATPQTTGQSLWGFMDSGGKVIIEPQYIFAREFHNDRAFVRLQKNAAAAQNQLIDKLGRVVSPPGINVIASYGPYIEVQDTSGNLGVMNHKDEYVIQPNYKSISAQLTTPPTVDESTAWYDAFTEPIYFFATRSDDGRPLILSQKGEPISTAPSELVWKGATSPPVLVDGISSFDLDSALFLAEGTAGKQNCNVFYRRIAPGILLKTIGCSREPRKNTNFARFQNFPSMSRTLHHYISEPLIPAVDAFEAGRYEEAIKH